MSSLNKVMLIGRLGQPPELTTTASGQQVAKFTLASEDGYMDKAGQWQSKTDWHKIVVWGKRAVWVAEWLGKGALVYFEGRLCFRSYEMDGKTHWVTEVVAREVQPLSGMQKRGTSERGTSEASAPEKGKDSLPGGGTPGDDDRIPY